MDKEITNINGQTGGNIPDGLPIPSRYWAILAIGLGVTAVSYTHLDVYKRQPPNSHNP